MNNYKTVLIIVDYFFISFIFAPILYGIIHREKLSKADFCILGLVISLILLEIVSETLRYNNIRNHFLYYFQTLFISVSVFLFFGGNNLNYGLKRMLLFSSVLVWVLLPVEMAFISGFNHLNSLTKPLCLIQISLFSIYFLKRNLALHEQQIKRNLFFHNVGLAVFGLISIIPSIFDKLFLESSVSLFYFFETLSLIGNAVAYVFFTIGFWNSKINKSV